MSGRRESAVRALHAGPSYRWLGSSPLWRARSIPSRCTTIAARSSAQRRSRFDPAPAIPGPSSADGAARATRRPWTGACHEMDLRRQRLLGNDRSQRDTSRPKSAFVRGEFDLGSPGKLSIQHQLQVLDTHGEFSHVSTPSHENRVARKNEVIGLDLRTVTSPRHQSHPSNMRRGRTPLGEREANESRRWAPSLSRPTGRYAELGAWRMLVRDACRNYRFPFRKRRS